MMTPKGLKTFDDLWALGEDVRAELVDGAIEPRVTSNEHSEAMGNLQGWTWRRFDRKPGGRWPGGWWIRPEIHVVYSATNIYCHDLAGWRRDRVATMPKGWVEVRPDWVCEIMSPTHKKRDQVDKLQTLHAKGVPHYWIIDREERIVFLHTHQPKGYVVRTVEAGEVMRAEPFDAVELRTGVVFGDEDDED